MLHCGMREQDARTLRRQSAVLCKQLVVDELLIQCLQADDILTESMAESIMVCACWWWIWGQELRQRPSMVLDSRTRCETFDRFGMHLYLGRISTHLSKIASAASASFPSARGTVLGSLKASNASYIRLNVCEKVPQTLTVHCPVHAEWNRQTVHIKYSMQIETVMCYQEFSLITPSRRNMPFFSCLPAAI